MTYSIIARNPVSGEIGLAVANRFFAVGSLVPHIKHNSAIATQAFVNPMWGIKGSPRLAGGESAKDVMAESVAQERAAHFAKTFATSDNFSGTTDRTELDRSISEREAQWARDGIVTQSFANPL